MMQNFTSLPAAVKSLLSPQRNQNKMRPGAVKEQEPVGAEHLGFQIVNASAAEHVPILKCDLYIKLTDDLFYSAKVYRACDLNFGENHLLAILLNFGKDMLLKSSSYNMIINAMQPNGAQLIYPNPADLSKCYLVIGSNDISYLIQTKFHFSMAIFGARLRLVFVISSTSEEKKRQKDSLYMHILQFANQRIEFNKVTAERTFIGLRSKRLPIHYRNGQKDEMLILYKNEPYVEFALTLDIGQIYKRVACEAALHLNGNVIGNAKVAGYFSALQQYGRYVRQNGLITRWSDPGGMNVPFGQPTLCYFSSMPYWFRVVRVAVPPSSSNTDSRFVIQYDDSGISWGYVPPYFNRPGVQRIYVNAIFTELNGFAFINHEDVHFFKITELPRHYSITVYIYKMPGNYIHLETTDLTYFQFLKDCFLAWLAPAGLVELDLSRGLIGRLLNRGETDPLINRNFLNLLMHSAARGHSAADEMMSFPTYGTIARRMGPSVRGYQETSSLVVSDIKQTMQQLLTRLAMVLVENEADKWLPALQVHRDRTGSRSFWHHCFRLGIKAIKRFSTDAPRYWSETLQMANRQNFRSLKPQYRLQFNDYQAPF